MVRFFLAKCHILSSFKFIAQHLILREASPWIVKVASLEILIKFSFINQLIIHHRMSLLSKNVFLK